VSFFASLNGSLRVTAAKLAAPYAGVWVVDVTADGVGATSGAATVRVGSLELVGTVDPRRSGVYRSETRLRIVGGARGWRSVVKARPYHNDAGLKRSRLVQDVANDCGETVVLPAGLDMPTMGVDFVRESARASRILEQLLGPSLAWRVGLDGVTRIGAPEASEVGKGVELVAYDPRTGLATLSLDGAGLTWGTVLRDSRLTEARKVRDFAIELSSSKLSALAWTVAA
jgi:hypothetical protein